MTRYKQYMTREGYAYEPEEEEEKPQCEVCENEAVYRITILGEDEFYACETHKHDF